MTVWELNLMLANLIQQGCADKPVKIFDPDSEEGGFYPITGMTILDGEIQLHCDEL
jgi:hypothetical protein